MLAAVLYRYAGSTQISGEQKFTDVSKKLIIRTLLYGPKVMELFLDVVMVYLTLTLLLLVMILPQCFIEPQVHQKCQENLQILKTASLFQTTHERQCFGRFSGIFSTERRRACLNLLIMLHEVNWQL